MEKDSKRWRETHIFVNKVFYRAAHKNIIDLLMNKEDVFTEEDKEKLRKIYQYVVKIEMLLYQIESPKEKS